MDGGLFIILAVIQLILLVKVWKACNAVIRLGKKFAPEDEVNNIVKEREKRKSESNPTPETKQDIDKWLNG